MPRIALLSDELINKIAAGEVVERPASVVKELCENALDAGARSIRVQLLAGGLELVRIVDDGEGMTREEALLALQRHATSKLRDLEGLFAILTKGFRGEALPAIASVSRFSLTTAKPGAAMGSKVLLSGGASLEVENAAPVPGTDIRVEELFFNTPARRKFLKREQTELGHAHDAVLRLALPHPEVAFHLEHAGKTLFSAAANSADARERVAAALGPEVFEHLLPIEEDRLGVRVRGYVVAPSLSLSNARGLYTFVNRRYVRDRGLNFAVQRGFQEALAAGRQPMAVILIDMDPAAVDVNVHPQKLEVRFADPRGITDAVFSAIRRAVRSGMAAILGGGVGSVAPSEAHYASAVERFLSRATEAAWGGPLPLPTAHDLPSGPERLGFGMARPDINAAPPPAFFAGLRWIGPLAKRFWLCEDSGGTLVVVDVHAAWERFHLAAFLERVVRLGAEPQRVLFSKTVTLGAEEALLIGEGAAVLRELGIDVEPFGGDSLAVKGLPVALHGTDLTAVLNEICRVLPTSDREVGPGADGRWIPACRVLACHAARDAATRNVSQDEVRTLFRRLDEIDFQLEPRHPAVVLQQTTFFELAAKAEIERPVS